MAYFNQCPICHANLDPGERCEDCMNREAQEEKRANEEYVLEAHGQLRLVFPEESVR